MASFKGSYKGWPSFLRFFETNSSERWLFAFDNLARHSLLSLVVLLTFDALANPYAGIVHDARLYAVQALSHLHPGRYDKDLFFLFGSQDSFSVFSIVHARIIALFGFQWGTWILYILCRTLFLASLLTVFRRFLDNNAQAFFAACLIAAGQVHYIFFDVNEPFLTSRLGAVAFSLLGLAAALRSSHKSCVVLLLVAGLLHPLMVLGPGAVILVLWVRQRLFRFLGIVVGASLLALIAIFLLEPKGLLDMDFLAVLDSDWREIIYRRSSYLFPYEWSVDEWKTVCGTLLLVGFAMPYLTKDQRQFLTSAALVVALSLLGSIMATYFLSLALPFQVQLWRSFWVLRILSPGAALFWGWALWKRKEFSRKMAAPMVVIPAVLSGGIASADLYWVICAGVLSILPLRVLDSKLSEGLKRQILVVEIIVLLITPLPVVMTNFEDFLEPGGLRLRMLSFVASLGPFFRPTAVLVLFAFFARLRPGLALCFLVPFLILAILPGVSPHFKYPLLIELERSLKKTEPIGIPVEEWQGIIPPGSMILTDGSIPVETIWFDFRVCSYYSHMQGPGILFSRKLAMEFARRQLEIKNVFSRERTGDLSLWSKKRHIDYFISRKRLPLQKVDERGGIFLYSTASSEI